MTIDAIRLKATPIVTSPLGLGTTSLLGLPRESERQQLLERAFDLGIRHFDTSPFYGYGEAEKTLGRFLRSRRDQVTVTTKFGIQPPQLMGVSNLAVVAKRLTRGLPWLRRSLARRAAGMVQRGAFDVRDARQSLERSLRALGTDHIDILLLHEATSRDTRSEDLLQFLNEQVGKGVIRTFGVGSEFERALGVIVETPAFAPVAQFDHNVLRPSLDRLPPDRNFGVITTRPLGEALARLISMLRADRTIAQGWSRELGVDCLDQSVIGGLSLAYAMSGNPSGIALFSTKSISHLEGNVAAIADRRYSAEQLSRFASLVAAESARRDLAAPA